MKLITTIKKWFSSLFKVKKPIQQKPINKDPIWEAKKQKAKLLKNTDSDDERIINTCIIRKMEKKELLHLSKVYKSKNVCIKRNNYKNYCYDTCKYKNNVYSFISLYKISKENRNEYKYILIYKHIKNNNEFAVFNLIAKLYLDLNGEPYYGKFPRLFENKKFTNKLWKKVEKIVDTLEYEKMNKKRRK